MIWLKDYQNLPWSSLLSDTPSKGLFQPISMINYEYKYNTSINTAISIQSRCLFMCLQKYWSCLNQIKNHFDFSSDRLIDHPRSWQARKYIPQILKTSNSNGTLTFSSFIQYLIKTLPEFYDSHWTRISGKNTINMFLCLFNFIYWRIRSLGNFRLRSLMYASTIVLYSKARTMYIL